MSQKNKLIEIATRIKDALEYYGAFIYEKQENNIVKALIRELELEPLLLIEEIVKGKHLLILEPNIKPCITECNYECRAKSAENEKCVKKCVDNCKKERLQHIINVIQKYISSQK